MYSADCRTRRPALIVTGEHCGVVCAFQTSDSALSIASVEIVELFEEAADDVNSSSCGTA
eukprot:6215670-Amphidinium_carterae.2